MKKNKFKVGDLVFVSNKKFTPCAEERYSVFTGHILIIKEIGFHSYVVDDGEENRYCEHLWNFLDAHKDLKLYSKKNWCSVFLRFMEDHKQQEFKNLTDPLIKFCNDSGNPYTKIVIDIDSAEIVTTERRAINKEFYRD